MRPILRVLLIVCAMLGPETGRAQIPHTTYDAFMTLDNSERLARFGQLAPENQAELQREHLTRWRKLRADSLTDEQQKFLDEVATFIRPENYTPGGPHRTQEEVQAFIDLQRRASELFTPEEFSEFVTLRGRFIRAQ